MKERERERGKRRMENRNEKKEMAKREKLGLSVMPLSQ